ncbi:MAG: hypothetical protein WCT28_03310 [Patescibacteria group bacterium]
MHSIILFLILFFGTVFATEPATTTDTSIDSIDAIKEARNNAIADYRAVLIKSRKDAEDQRAKALSTCESAKKDYLHNASPLAEVKEELKAAPPEDPTSEIADADRTYRGKLYMLQATYETGIHNAKDSAKTAGDSLLKAKADLEKIDSKIKKLDDQVERAQIDELNRCKKKYPPVLAASICNDQTPRAVDRGAYAQGVDYLFTKGNDHVSLPSEFAACFPDEAKAESKPKETEPLLPSSLVDDMYPLPKK